MSEKEKKKKVKKDKDLSSSSSSFSEEETSVVSTEATKVELTEKEKEKEANKKWYQKIKVPKPMAIILGILIFCIFLTWVIPHDAFFNVTYTDSTTGNIIQLHDPKDGVSWFDEAPFGLNFIGEYWYMPNGGYGTRYGILDTIKVIFAGFLGAAGVIFFVLCIGGFIEIMMASGTLEKGVGALENKMKGKEIILIPILFLLFSTGGTTYGMQEETIGFFPIIIPFLILAGFDSMTGFLVIVMGTTTGIAASTVNPFSVTVYADSVTSGGEFVANASSSDGIVGRFIIWILFTIIGATILTFYANRVHKDKGKSLLPKQYEDDLKWARDSYGGIDEHAEYQKMSKRQVVALWIFGGTFVLMIIGMMPWLDWFGWYDVNGDPNVPGWFNVISSLFFASTYIGWWFYIQLCFLFLTMTIVLGIVFKMSGKEIRTTMFRGARFMLGVAMIIGVARAISYVLIYSGLADSIVVFSLTQLGLDQLSPVLFTVLVFPIFLVMGAFITSTSGLASAVGGVMGSFINGMALGAANPQATADGLIIGTMLAYSLATGIMNMWSPTNGLLLAQAEASHLDYPKIFKPMFMYAVLITILSFVAIPIVTMIAI